MRVLRSIPSVFLLVATGCATTAEFGYSSGPGYYDDYYAGYSDYYPYDAYAGYPYSAYPFGYYPYASYYPYAGYYPYANYRYHAPGYAPVPQRNVTIARPPQYTPPATAPPSAAPRTPAGPPSTTIARPPGR